MKIKINKRKIILGLCMILSISVTGCFKWEYGDNKGHQDSGGKEDNVMELTDDEKDMLCGLYGNEERIRAGRLITLEIEAVNQYRYANQYLSEKYPGYEFELFHFSPLRLATSETMSYFREKNTDSDEYYELFLEGKDGVYSVRDNFFWHLIGPVYDAELTKRLKTEGLEDFYVKTVAMCYMGTEVDGNTTVEELIEEGKEWGIQINLRLYVDMPGVEGEDTDKVMQMAEKVVRDMNQYGAHDVCFGEGGVDAVKNGEKIKVSDGSYYIQFNTFDLRK